MLKQNKDFKINSSLMERKVDELSDENGELSSQVNVSSINAVSQSWTSCISLKESTL